MSFDMKNDFSDDSDSEYKGDLTMKSHGGITPDRIVNMETLQVIEDLLKCPICLNFLNNPYECELCGGLFCEDCIQAWLKTKEKCPMRCAELKIKRADVNSRKLLNKIILKCQNYPDCDFTASYWDLFSHEEKCNFQKVKCPNKPCKYGGKFSDFLKHQLICSFGNMQCGFCKALIPRCDFISHFNRHQENKTFIIKNCSYCGNSQDLRRCLCNESICINCLEENNLSLHEKCFEFSTGLTYTTKFYNISKKPLPLNFECKISFISVGWIRVGITFEPKIADFEEDTNCPPYDIYCILEDLKQFYTYKNKWKYVFKNKDMKLEQGDIMIMRFKNGELRYIINGEDLGNVIKIPFYHESDFYLFIQCRTDKSKAKVEYITEIFD